MQHSQHSFRKPLNDAGIVVSSANVYRAHTEAMEKPTGLADHTVGISRLLLTVLAALAAVTPRASRGLQGISTVYRSRRGT